MRLTLGETKRRLQQDSCVVYIASDIDDDQSRKRQIARPLAARRLRITLYFYVLPINDALIAIYSGACDP